MYGRFFFNAKPRLTAGSLKGVQALSSGSAMAPQEAKAGAAVTLTGKTL
ncbi:hypothetical protein CLV24_101161 [Pontibacter ummariensis]|uniref:Uncharacterized protein n=1 Tax=Pontibacter ummariensis TaxID=1610492 RepID=A0A239B5H2_9BACT|nr:hypothetical protein [Pontibacter ummariensis]PRY16316.1 hypothetical protein CLV24_101161 [Pontibacter ummariensis]SNS03049.1 hypothetical protein SAMN06296052_101161 [Pontibacter ummariensis]